jgi:hypothetical protein
MGSSKAYWYVQNRIIYVHNLGDLTGDDFRLVDKQIIALMQAAQAAGITKTHVLVDSVDMRKLPHIMDLEGGRILKYMKEANCGWTVVVGYRNNPFLAVLSRFLTSVMKVNLYMADTMSKGISLFKQIEPDLRELPDVEQWKKQTIGISSEIR